MTNITYIPAHKFDFNNDFYNNHAAVQIASDAASFFIGDDYVSLEELAYEY